MILSNEKIKVMVQEDYYSSRIGVRFLSGDFSFFLSGMKQIPFAEFDRKTKVWYIPPELGLLMLSNLGISNTQLVGFFKSKLSYKQNISLGESLFNKYYPLVLSKYLKSKLYSFQEEACKFLIGTKGAILNADIGLGKTFTSLVASLLLYEHWKSNLKPDASVIEGKNRFRVLIVTKSSLKYHWEQQIKEHLKNVDYVVVDGPGKRRTYQYQYPALFTITSYELVRIPSDLETLKKIKFNIIIADEVTKIKNFRTKTYKAMLKIPSVYRWGLTGSVIENSPVDLFSIFNFIDKDKFNNNWKAFKDAFLITRRIDLPDGRWFEDIVGYKNLELLKLLTKPYIWIKRKRDVVDLPPLTIKNYWLKLTPKQNEIYDRYATSIATNMIDPLAGLTYLREVVDSPRLLGEEGESSKVTELISLLEETGDEKVLVFSQYKRFVKLVDEELKKSGYKTVVVTGDDSSEEKMKKVELFNNYKGKLIMLATDVIAYGMNLQHSCSILINLDLPWNPMKLENRIGRLDRLGQTKPVLVINLLTKDTIEEKVYEILNNKQELIKKLLSIETKKPENVYDRDFLLWLIGRGSYNG